MPVERVEVAGSSYEVAIDHEEFQQLVLTEGLRYEVQIDIEDEEKPIPGLQQFWELEHYCRHEESRMEAETRPFWTIQGAAQYIYDLCKADPEAYINRNWAVWRRNIYP